MTYSRGKWAARNMKLAQIDYLSTPGRAESRAEQGGEERTNTSTSCLFLPEGSSHAAIARQTADLYWEQLYPNHTRTKLHTN